MIDKMIMYLKEIQRIERDMDKQEEYPDEGEPFDYNANALQILSLLELVDLYLREIREDSVLRFKIRLACEKCLEKIKKEEEEEDD